MTRTPKRNGSLTGRQDKKEQARRAGEAIEAALADSDLQLGWDKAKRWYRVARGAPVQPYFKSMAKQTAERDVNGWLRGMEDEEDPEKRAEGAGNQWRLFVALIQLIWRTGEILQQMLWTIIVLIPKGSSGDYRGIGLLEPFWKVIEGIMDTRLGPPFKASRGVTQGGPLSPKIFNIMVGAIVRKWICQLLYKVREETELSDSVAEPLNTLSILLALLYADNAYIASTSRRVVQDSMDILTELFDRVGLRTNTEKTKVMTCVNENIHVQRSEEVYRNTAAGFHTEKAWRNRKVTCDHCGLEMSAKSLPSHLDSQHGIYRSRTGH
ncbi:hypothetical protein THAOC_22766 [Thalassiosira oceanica]|uniref:Reverse transcriptase domain-containing protein n=1 Tax=Thalassiosira oceanica TaxID=159749 RepID=K0S8N1_THAOC|nr:hypothetical protein THAOC_22766 [Thalassiosira oceanica]|eukprot:EJK57216.1 hypothetical protein THAOC_22766 [Thalassiosira oceanica]